MRRRVVRTTTLVPLLLTTLALTLLPTLTAGPATAGGPTSVLLSSPTLGRTTSLYMTDSAYDALAKEVGAFSNGAGVSETPAKEPTGEAVTAT